MLKTLRTKDWFAADGLPVAIERRDPQPAFPPHRHEFSEIVLVTSGTALHVVGRESWPLTAGDVFVIGGSQSHEYRELENLCLINVLYQPDKLRMDPVDLAQLPGYHVLFSLEPRWTRRHGFRSRLHLTPARLAGVLALVDDLEAELKSKRPGHGLMVTALFMQIVGQLSRLYEQSETPDTRNLVRVAEVLSHMESHLHEGTRLDELARVGGMSKRSLIRAFHEATGMTPIEYSLQLRINRAAGLLRNEPITVTDAAFRVGFNDSNYFTRQFRKRLGVSPRRYQRQHLPVSG
jgi:AraC-like DNA-binding protein/mannose-6-phosphate isomerase-like protein (cupin superfamily)